ncbi:MAG: FAD-dependent oxidoreductase, partial [Actinomycetes bacterium]
MSADSSRPEDVADVVIVGAGPAGSTTAYYLAQAGLDVVLLEKTAFPREKVCGDGLTPRAVEQLLRMGIDTTPEAGWIRNHGLRIIGGGMRLELPWPELASFPDYGLVRPRLDFDEILASQAVKAGARLYERMSVTGPVVDETTGRVTAVTAREVDDAGRKTGPERRF